MARRLGAMIAAVVPAVAGWLAGGAHAEIPPPGANARAASATCPGASLLPTPSNARAVDAATLCLIDHIRASHHLRPLRRNRELGSVAASQLGAMVHWNYFADVRPSGLTPMALVSATRYPAHAARYAVGQNIGWGSGGYATPASIVAAWMSSPPHRRLILTAAYRDAGAAASASVPSVLGTGGVAAIYALEFGNRLP
jgi:uncharacterized protein YkwD